ncbi:MAG TPA: hypothetical protein VHI78_05250 [Bacteroidales bacterium]|jgi:hypothetical protein|nr:hypothetical protein [Bacteroidales bacterium]
MKSILFLALILCTLTSCDEKIFTGNVNCDECYVEKPGNADLVIDLTINNKFSAVPVTVYYGDAEDNRIVVIDTAYTTPYYLYVPVDRKYSVKAEYRTDKEVINAVDGTNLRVLSVTDACDVTCYVIENEKMDVRLKREFR